MKKSVLREYARLIVRTGVNVRKGQDVRITADLDQPEFVAMVADEAYKAGAREVIVDWNYQALEKVHLRGASVKTLTTVHDWQKAKWEHYVDTLPAAIHLISDDPDGLKGVSVKKMTQVAMANRKAFKPYRDQMENKYQW